jgi:hypothetical protein
VKPLGVIRFKSGDEQPVVAEQAVEDEECLIFLNPDGELAALFNLTAVEEWHEIRAGESTT